VIKKILPVVTSQYDICSFIFEDQYDNIFMAVENKNVYIASKTENKWGISNFTWHFSQMTFIYFFKPFQIKESRGISLT
jgi:hypothetical protein